MAATDRTSPSADYEAIAARIESKLHEFHDAGEFSEIREAIRDDIHRRFQQLEKKVDAAASSGSTWQLIRAQFTHDVSTIFHHFLESIERLDAAEMKRHTRD